MPVHVYCSISGQLLHPPRNSSLLHKAVPSRMEQLSTAWLVGTLLYFLSGDKQMHVLNYRAFPLACQVGMQITWDKNRKPVYIRKEFNSCMIGLGHHHGSGTPLWPP